MCGEHAEGGEHCEHSEDGDHGEHSEDHFFSHCSPDGHITAARAVDRELCVYPLKGSLGIAHRGTNRAKILNFCSKTCFFDVLTLANALTDRNLQDGPGNFGKKIFLTPTIFLQNHVQTLSKICFDYIQIIPTLYLDHEGIMPKP